ncbi:hypothetical protein FHX09_005586 [Rhizobium sp. BK538]|nr:hypothetical protein [Rhizobium sp. BK060]MBB4171691.1 hypothetical protein [Rhizobium sp. BK538]TCM66877.1 hypothetical protein EV291_13850 [Rhizobium sp. BK068]
MSITYHVAEHDGAWAYGLDDVWSETFPTHEKHWQRPNTPQSDNSSVARMRTLHISVQTAAGQRNGRTEATAPKPMSSMTPRKKTRNDH